VTEALRAVAFAAVALGGVLAWVALDAARLDAAAPQRLVAELRLAQMAALLLALTSGIYVGTAVAAESLAGVGWDVALAVGFFVIAAIVTTWDPRAALTAMALAFAAHAGVDLLHTTDVLPAAVAPRWYVTGCAIYDILVGALCYLPVLRR